MQLIRTAFVLAESLLQIFKAGKINDCALPASREGAFKQRAPSANVSRRELERADDSSHQLESPLSALIMHALLEGSLGAC